jgi:hypothetical protein
MLAKEFPWGGMIGYCLGHQVFGIDEPVSGDA